MKKHARRVAENTKVRFAAIGPALLGSVLVFLDQNITARIVNSPDHKLHNCRDILFWTHAVHVSVPHTNTISFPISISLVLLVQ